LLHHSINFRSKLIPVVMAGLLLTISSSQVYSYKSYSAVWDAYYFPSSSGSNANCALCHYSYDEGDGYNDYGFDLKNTAGDLTSRLDAIASLNSDSDPTGSSNLAEILANTQPGWSAGSTPPAGVTGDLDPVPNNPPRADAGGPYNGFVGIALQFDASGSSDSDGSIVRYDWDFDDGTPVDEDAGATPSHTYVTAGDFTVELTVHDDDGATDTATATVSIADVPNQPPTADTGGPYNGFVGVALQFDGSASSDSDGSIVQYDWDYGDGSSETDAGPAPIHSFEAAGEYTLTVTVTDDDGATDSATATVVIEAEEPPAGSRIIRVIIPLLLE